MRDSPLATWSLEQARGWTHLGTGLLDEQLASLTDDEGEAPSLLPGWNRKHLAAHLVGNATALGNLVRWAATGTPTPMYDSPERRQSDIDGGASLPMDELLRRFGRTATELEHGMDDLAPQQWAAEVVTAQGRSVRAATIPWLRAREVMVHAVDLGTGLAFGDLPEAFLAALCADVETKRNSAAGRGPRPRLSLTIDGAEAQVVLSSSDCVEHAVVSGPLADITAYLAGRDPRPGVLAVVGAETLPELHPWL